MAKKKTQKYWKKKCDQLITAHFKGKKCAACGKRNGVAGHHLISRKVAWCRHLLVNLIPLCPTHHKFSNALAPHSSNAFAVKQFLVWLRTTYPRKYVFYRNNQRKKGIKVDYEEVYNRLKGELEQEHGD